MWIIGNWKMNGSRALIEALVPELVAGLGGAEAPRVAVCPPFPYLGEVARRLAGSRVALGAQNVASKPEGAFTGEVAPGMLAEFRVALCLVGHSERRQFYGETDALVVEKMKLLLNAQITPIVCVGESLHDREAGRYERVVEAQVGPVLAALTPETAGRIAIAYEPVWAVGTGVVATPVQAGEMHRHIRELFARRFPGEVASALPILYGGSVNADNADTLLTQPDIDGALVGGASLKAASFLAIIRHATP